MVIQMKEEDEDTMHLTEGGGHEKGDSTFMLHLNTTSKGVVLALIQMIRY